MNDLFSGPSLRMNETFDRRSFTRPGAALLNETFDRDAFPDGPVQSNATFRKDDSPPVVAGPLNSTYQKEDSSGVLGSTFRKDSGSGFNSTFRKEDILNGTFDIRSHNATFEVRSSSGSAGASANTTFEIRPSAAAAVAAGVNSTFEVRVPGDGSSRKLSEDRLSSTSSNSNVDHFSTHRLSRDSSHDLLDEDRLSTTSESSASHRLNDVGDVQHIARMQEESESFFTSCLPPSNAVATFYCLRVIEF